MVWFSHWSVDRAVVTAAENATWGLGMPLSALCTTPNLSPLAQHEVLAIAVIGGSRLCLRCVSVRSDLVEETLVSVIQRIQRSVGVTENIDDCDGCGRRTIVYRLRLD